MTDRKLADAPGTVEREGVGDDWRAAWWAAFTAAGHTPALDEDGEPNVFAVGGARAQRPEVRAMRLGAVLALRGGRRHSGVQARRPDRTKGLNDER